MIRKKQHKTKASQSQNLSRKERERIKAAAWENSIEARMAKVESTSDFKERLASMIPEGKEAVDILSRPCLRTTRSGFYPAPQMNPDPTKPLPEKPEGQDTGGGQTNATAVNVARPPRAKKGKKGVSADFGEIDLDAAEDFKTDISLKGLLNAVEDGCTSGIRNAAKAEIVRRFGRVCVSRLDEAKGQSTGNQGCPGKAASDLAKIRGAALDVLEAWETNRLQFAVQELAAVVAELGNPDGSEEAQALGFRYEKGGR